MGSFIYSSFLLNCALQSCKDAMGESSSLQDRSVLEVSEDTIAVTVCTFTGTKELQGSPYAEQGVCHPIDEAMPRSGEWQSSPPSPT